MVTVAERRPFSVARRRRTIAEGIALKKTFQKTILLLLTPICFALKIPYVVPICAGLVGSPVSVISTGCGVVSWHLLHYVAEN